MASTVLSSRYSSLFHPNFSSVLPCSASPAFSFRYCGGIQPQEVSRAPVVAFRLRCSTEGRRRTLPSLRHREGLGDASLSLNRLGFKKGWGLKQQQRWGRQSNNKKYQGQTRTEAFSRGRRGFSRAEEDENDESKKIFVPLIGVLPFGRPDFSKVTPMRLLVWLTIGILIYSVSNLITSNTIFNPRFWMYSSWILVKWPWPAAILVAITTLVTAFRSSKRQPKEWEQVLLLLGSLTWLILVPFGLFQGFVDGWPLVLFTLYTGFFLISAIVRYRLHGDLASKDEDKQWETVPSRLWQMGFIVSVVGGHWLAAYEAPFLYYTWNFDWKSKLAMATLALAVYLHYSASYFLGKYFDRLVKPRAVVMFGPYRIVRHPIYASYMLLFAGYCLALRSYKSLLFLIIACIAYYEHRTNLEENLLVGAFGDLYKSYRERVANKYFPLLY